MMTVAVPGGIEHIFTHQGRAGTHHIANGTVIASVVVTTAAVPVAVTAAATAADASWRCGDGRVGVVTAVVPERLLIPFFLHGQG